MNFKKYHVSRNLLNKSLFEDNGQLSPSSGLPAAYNGRIVTTTPVDVSNINSVTLTYSLGSSYDEYYMYSTFSGTTLIERVAGKLSGDSIDVSNADKLYIALYVGGRNITTDSIQWIMLNTGSTPLPYEPYGDTWHDTPHYIHNTSTDTLTTLPAVLYPNDTTATVGLEGNTVQNGTPTPDNPVMPQGTGERTGNLFDKTFASGYNISSNGNPTSYTNNSRCATLEPIDVSEQNTVTFSYSTTASDNKKFIYSLFNGNTFVIREAEKLSGTSIDVSLGDKLYLCVYSNLASVNAAETTTNIMLNSGSTALPHEPYGIKIPISSANTTIPVYLGEVETTRKIKKLVLTGGENWTLSTAWKSTNTSVFYTTVSGANNQDNDMRYVVSDRFISASRNEVNSGDTDMIGLSARNALTVRISDNIATTLTEFQTYLSTQYTNGAPVTAWYVLATEETAVVNEPLMRIGNYADEVSGIAIPVTAGEDTLSVGTTIPPSEVTVNYKGWHPIQSVHEYDSNYTIATMQALTIAQLQTHTISDLQGEEWS